MVTLISAVAIVMAVGMTPSALARSPQPKCSISGTDGPNVIRGTSGPDVICGGGGADTLYGGAGDDRILGGSGKDKLYGGPGKDFADGGKGGDVCHGQADDSGAVSCAVVGSAPRLSELAPGPLAPAPLAGSSSPIPIGPSCDESQTCTPAPTPEPPHDETAPVLSYLALGQKFIDTSEGLGTVTIYLHTWDDGSPHSGSLVIDGPEGVWRTIEIPESESYLGEYQLPVTIPTSTPAGHYRIVEVNLEDEAGNSASLDRGQLEEDEHGNPTWFGLDFDVYSGPDTTPPVLKGFSIAPDSVDTSGGPATIDYTVEASDDLSGVEIAVPAFRTVPAEPLGNTWIFSYGAQLVSGTIFDGGWEGHVPLPAHARQGVYPVERLDLRDRAGNEVSYERSELETMGLPLQFEQEGEGDTTPPEILDFEIEPRTISTANGQRSFKVRMHVRDELSGFGEWPEKSFSDLWFSFDEPGHPQQFESSGRAAELVSGTELDGEWLLEAELPSDASVGEYPITYVSATDRAGNQTLVKDAELAAKPWDLSFENLP
jgi:hypothetical protein